MGEEAKSHSHSSCFLAFPIAIGGGVTISILSSILRYMYTDEDLSLAVKNGILQQEKVDELRNFIAGQKNTKTADEENFKLITGFNDIFVSIAAFILMVSIGSFVLWLFRESEPTGDILAYLIVAGISWLLSLLFVLKRRLALPAVLFLLSFIFSVAACSYFVLGIFKMEEETNFLLSQTIGIIAAWLHWRKFHVPITVAVGVALLTACLLNLILRIEAAKDYIYFFAGSIGTIVFLFAMYWDSKDTTRLTRQSDVAFWLHLLAAPMIVHPVFSILGIFEGESNNILTILVVIFVYLLLGAISIVIDRRALMASALIYVLFAFERLFDLYGATGPSLAVSGILIGSALLFLSAFWHKSRKFLFYALPKAYTAYLPDIK